MKNDDIEFLFDEDEDLDVNAEPENDEEYIKDPSSDSVFPFKEDNEVLNEVDHKEIKKESKQISENSEPVEEKKTLKMK